VDICQTTALVCIHEWKEQGGRKEKKKGGGENFFKKILCLRRNMNVAVLSIVEVQTAYLLNLCSLAQYI